MRTVFGDAGYWIALHQPHEDLYPIAHALTARLAPLRVVTSELVLTEYLNEMSGQGPNIRSLAPAWIAHLRRDSTITIVPMTSGLFDAALRLYASRPDKDWGL